MSDQDGSELQYDVSELPIEDFFHYSPSLALACIALSLYLLVSAAAGGARRCPALPRPALPPRALQLGARCQRQPPQPAGHCCPAPCRPPWWSG